MSESKPPQLSEYKTGDFQRGRSRFIELIWIVVQALFVSSFLPGSTHRRVLLTIFGSRIGKGVIIKPGVKVKFPWRLVVGDHSWIGENAWIDNLAQVNIGSNVCLSQGTYLCTGNHDWSSSTFDLKVAPITLEDGSWVAAKATIGPGVTLGCNAIVALGAVATKNVSPGRILSASVFLNERSREIVERSSPQ